MRTIPLLAMIMPLILLGCCIGPPAPPSHDSVPPDLYIIYSDGACHAEWGRSEVIITADGNGISQSGSGSYEDGRFEEEESRLGFTLSEEELLFLLNAIEGSGFYSLDDTYTDMSIMDGSCEYISVTADNKTKGVSISNTSPPEAYRTARSAIMGVAEEKGAG
jgi:hypothetical protein